MNDLSPRQPEPSTQRTRRFRWLTVLAVLVAIGTGLAILAQNWLSGNSAFLLRPVTQHADVPRLLAEAEAALKARDYDKAERLATRVLSVQEKSPGAIRIGAQAMLKLNRTNEALAYFQRIPEDNSDESIRAHMEAANYFYSVHRLTAAEQHLRAILKQRPDHIEAHSRLALLLVAEGRRWESMPVLLKLVQQKNFTLEQLFLLSDPGQTIDYSDILLPAREKNPQDAMPALGLARVALEKQEIEKGHKLLRDVLRFAPHQFEAQAMLGASLLEHASLTDFLDWHAALPPGADEASPIWYVRGLYAQKQGQLLAAARCFWEAVRREPNHAEANYRLSQVLLQLDRGSEAAGFAERAQLLDRLRKEAKPIYESGPSPERMLRLGQICEELGRLWEAWAWYHAVLAYYPTVTQAQPERDRLAQQLEAEQPGQTLASANPANHLDLSSHPLPNLDQVGGLAGALPPRPQVADLQVKFEDITEAAGLKYMYVNGDNPEEPGMQIFQQLGGAIVVFDYDMDGWPDIYLSQGCQWPPDPDQTEHRDLLYRNLGNGRFAEVTAEANLGDTGFSQGAAAGDIDNDGFPDLYVANIGSSRLYHNNGDGTFTEITQQAGITGERWGTSCAIADFNGDRLPDIFEVTYLEGPEPFKTICKSVGIRACSPELFRAERDRLFLNGGDGTFRDVSEEANVTAKEGKGLGLVVADFDRTGRLSVFVANDTTANHFYLNQQAQPGDSPLFVEEGMTWGLALDEDGMSRACMGIAIDDADNDSYLDMVVTNFENERNNFYRQQSEMYFIDDPRGAGLADASHPVLGFGIQFLDAELDGLPDLVVANGHVDDFRHMGKPFKMRPQYFANLGNGRFAELPAGNVGSYFLGMYLGRALARLDWNRDGRDDFAVMHLDVPFALLSNQTPPQGRYVSLQLRGVQSDRDAIGTRVELVAGGRTYHKQLTAGDGFQVSNDRQLTVGLGDVQQIEKLVVRWPSGTVQEFQELPVDRHFVLIEGRQPLARVDVSVPQP